jgi:cytoskeletal protein RodZ
VEKPAPDLDWVARSDQPAELDSVDQPRDESDLQPVADKKYTSDEAHIPPNATLDSERERDKAEYPEVTWVTPRQRRTSPLFWGLASVLILVVVILGGWWIRVQFFQQEESEQTLASLSSGMDISRSVGDGLQETEMEMPREDGAEDLSTETISPSAGSEAQGRADDQPTSDPSLSGPTVRDPNISDQSVSGESVPEPTTGDQGITERSGSDLTTAEAPAGVVARTGSESSVASSAGDRVTSPVDQEPDRAETDPYQGPVGAAGWAVHLYSLPDSAGALKQVTWLDRKGIEAEWRAVDLGEKGRWYRVYAGSFPTKEAAQEAIPALKQRLGLDWAMPKRY